jgi:phosphatidylglycerol---prolipoprotein diacylglyceryl transferase
MNWYALIIGLGASLGILEVVHNAPPGQVQRYVDAALLCLFASLAGARLVYVTLHSSYYGVHLQEAWQLWQGGLSAPGAMAGGLLAAFCLAKVMHVSFFKFADILAPMLAPLAVAVWLGCWTAGVAYGLPAPVGSWWGVSALDETGVALPRFPLQLIAAFCLAVFLGRIEFAYKPFKLAGQKACLITLGINSVYLAATFLMGDPAPRWLSLRPESWMAIFLTLLNLAACAFVFQLIPPNHKGVS